MTELHFHTGVDDPLAYTCRLLRKGWRSGRSLVVTGTPQTLDELDQLLWTFEPGEFVPHLRLQAAGSAPAHLQRTPIWLVDEALTAPWRDVLVHLGSAAAPELTKFKRLIEVVGSSPDQAQAGRQRWRQYLSQGLEPQNHPQAQSEG